MQTATDATLTDTPAQDSEDAGFDPVMEFAAMMLAQTEGEEAPETEPEKEKEADPDETQEMEEAEIDPAAETVPASTHREMKEKLKTRTEILNRLAEKLGVKSAAEVETAIESRLSEPAPLPVTLATPQRPLASVGAEKDLSLARDYWAKQQEWCMENAGGGEFTFTGEDGKPEVREVDAAWVKNHAKLAVRVLTEDIPARQKFLAEIRENERVAGETFPYYQKDAPPEQRKALQEIMADLTKYVPEIVHYPRISELLGDACSGRLTRLYKHGVAVGADGKLVAKALTNGKPAAPAGAKTPPTSKPGSSPPPSRKTGPDEQMAAAIEAGDYTGAIKAHLFGKAA